MRRTRILFLAIVFAAGLGSGLYFAFRPSTASACSSCSSVYSAQVTLTDSTGTSSTLNIWQNQSNGRDTLQWAGDTESSVVQGTTVTVVIDGDVESVDSYQNSADAWNRISHEYGVSQSDFDTAIASTGVSVTTEPADSTATTNSLTTKNANGNNQYASAFQKNLHFGAAVANLQTAIGFAVPQVTSLDGYSLIDSSSSHLYGPDTNDSWPFAELHYGASSDPYNSALTVDVAVPEGVATAFGDIYKSMVSSTPNLTGPGYAATLVDDNQAVFQKGSTYIAVTATWAPTTTEWQSILSTLASA